MRLGDIVRNKKTGKYGTVHYSTFGVSIHVWDEENKRLHKTVGAPVSEVSQYWEVVDLPEGYEVCEYGGLRKVK
jgi:hypothetical protein